MLNFALSESRAPRIQCLPLDVVTSLDGEDACRLADSAGVHLDDWQRYAIHTMLARRSDGKWAAYEHATTVPRQNGKGEIILVRQLAGLYLLEEDLVISSAHEFKTANESFLRLVGVIEDTPHLKAEVRSIRYANGEQGVELRSGQRLKFVARSKGSGRGMTADCVILDEAYSLGSDQVSALLYTLSARPNAQLIYASSAAMVTSTQLLKLRKRAIDNERGRLAYLEWSADPKDDFSSPDTWRKANPALGIRIDLDTVEAEFHTADTQSFARERLGIPDDEDGTGSAIPLDVWQRLADPDSEIDGRLSIALEVSPEREWASFGAAGFRRDGLLHGEVVDRRPGTGWVVKRGAELALRWSTPLVVQSGSPAEAFVSELRAAGVEVDVVPAKQLAAGCGQLVDACANDQFRHLGQPSLLAALTGAHRRQSGDVWLWSRTASAVDITPLVAVTLALSAARVPVAAAHSADVFVSLDDF